MNVSLLCLLPATAGAALALHFVILDLRGVTETNCPGYARPICITLRQTRWYRILLGIPNPVWALLYFILCLWAVATIPHSAFVSTMIRAIAGIGVIYALALQAVLIFSVKVVCSVCLIFTVLAILAATCTLL